jgi:hypothetical protein
MHQGLQRLKSGDYKCCDVPCIIEILLCKYFCSATTLLLLSCCVQPDFRMTSGKLYCDGCSRSFSVPKASHLSLQLLLLLPGTSFATVAHALSPNFATA